MEKIIEMYLKDKFPKRQALLVSFIDNKEQEMRVYYKFYNSGCAVKFYASISIKYTDMLLFLSETVVQLLKMAK